MSFFNKIYDITVHGPYTDHQHNPTMAMSPTADSAAEYSLTLSAETVSHARPSVSPSK